MPVSQHFVTRYPQIRSYRLFLTVRVSEQTYCGEYNTAVIQEMDDLFAAKGKEIAIMLNGKRLTVMTPTGRKLKAWLSEPRNVRR
jgi:F0F1-type ATP synthase gamma subunit